MSVRDDRMGKEMFIPIDKDWPGSWQLSLSCVSDVTDITLCGIESDLFHA